MFILPLKFNLYISFAISEDAEIKLPNENPILDLKLSFSNLEPNTTLKLKTKPAPSS